MAALLHDDRPEHRTVCTEPVARFLGLVPEPVPTAPGPALRLIPGGREAVLRRRLPEHVYRARRRRVAVGLAGVVLTVALALTWRPGDRSDDPVDPAGAAVPPAAAVATGEPATSYVVQPGDTLWGIATSLEPEGDVRQVVDELAERAGPGPLEAGERLDLTGLAG